MPKFKLLKKIVEKYAKMRLNKRTKIKSALLKKEKYKY
jgi:hypothetical protein